MGLHLPKRMPLKARRAAWAITASVTLLMVSSCSIDGDQVRRLGEPVNSEGATDRSDSLHAMWMWSWLAAIIVGVLVWGLIAYVVIAYRRKSPDEVPVQTRYNLPLEMLYTLAPVVVVLVFFYYTVSEQNKMFEPVDNPDHIVDVVGQQWSWTFNYTKDDALDGTTTVFQPGSTDRKPTLYLVEGESVRFRLHSPDVIHDFWVPGFLQKMDVVPGLVNSFDLTPERAGTFSGKCAELCGVYHSRMLFDVKVVDRAEFAAKLRELQAAGNIGPALGAQGSLVGDGALGDNQDGENP